MKVDWAYLRKGWVSCKRALEFLEQKKIEIDVAVDARKVKLFKENCGEISDKINKLYVARGKKVLTFAGFDLNNEEILKISFGRSGTLRAPSLRFNGNLVIGFNEDLYKELFI